MQPGISLVAQIVAVAFLSLSSTIASAGAATPSIACGAVAPRSSGPRTASVIELYTSEGCDSCPPADKWFSTLSFRRDGVVPLAFHVDYWDYIGWKDPFGKAAWTERQRSTVARQGGRVVYTPQVLLDGRDARAWAFNSKFDAGMRDLAARPARAALRLAVNAVNPAATAIVVKINVNIADAALRDESALFIALTENNLQSRVTAGENRGRTLKHDHVVRALLGPIPIPSDPSGAIDIQRQVDLGGDWKRADLNIAGFVQNQRSGEVLQALSAPLCGP
ncbi:MAG TPA: DUF1223 domain-containing protein [Usitatibacteraceae bacterium]